MRSRPAPPYSSGTVRPNSPSSFMPSTIFSGNSSRCSSSSATGMTSFSTKSRTVSTTAFCSSVSSMRPVSLAVVMASGLCVRRSAAWRPSWTTQPVPAQTGEPGEVGVERDDLRAVLDGQRREMSVVDEIASRAYNVQQIEEDGSVSRARIRDHGSRGREPPTDQLARMAHVQRGGKGITARAQSQERDDHEPAETDGLVAGERCNDPVPGEFMCLGSFVHAIEENVRVDDLHRGWLRRLGDRSRPILRMISSSSISPAICNALVMSILGLPMSYVWKSTFLRTGGTRAS